MAKRKRNQFPKINFFYSDKKHYNSLSEFETLFQDWVELVVKKYAITGTNSSRYDAIERNGQSKDVGI